MQSKKILEIIGKIEFCSNLKERGRRSLSFLSLANRICALSLPVVSYHTTRKSGKFWNAQRHSKFEFQTRFKARFKTRNFKDFETSKFWACCKIQLMYTVDCTLHSTSCTPKEELRLAARNRKQSERFVFMDFKLSLDIFLTILTPNRLTWALEFKV